jgi:hypothetical protein
LGGGQEIAFARARAPAFDREDSKSLRLTQILDRVLKARPSDFDSDDLDALRGWLHHVMCKNGPRRNPHVPDLVVTAQVLACAPMAALIPMLRDLLDANTRVGSQYGWFVTVALDRIHGIRAEELAARRAALKLVGRRGKPAVKNPAVEPEALQSAPASETLVPPNGQREDSREFVAGLMSELLPRAAAGRGRR